MQSESGVDFATRKEELEQKLRDLDQERMSLMKEIEFLKQKRTLMDLEKRSNAMEETVMVLRKQRDELQGEISDMGLPEGVGQQAGPEGQT